MAHILAGKWKSFIVKNGNPMPDDEFDLKINEGNGQFESGCKHGNADVTGAASPGASARHHIKIDQANPASQFKGFLLVNGPQLIMVGIARLDIGTALGGGDVNPSTLFDQQQEIWIATKP